MKAKQTTQTGQTKLFVLFLAAVLLLSVLPAGFVSAQGEEGSSISDEGFSDSDMEEINKVLIEQREGFIGYSDYKVIYSIEKAWSKVKKNYALKEASKNYIDEIGKFIEDGERKNLNEDEKAFMNLLKQGRLNINGELNPKEGPENMKRVAAHFIISTELYFSDEGQRLLTSINNKPIPEEDISSKIVIRKRDPERSRSIAMFEKQLNEGELKGVYAGIEKIVGDKPLGDAEEAAKKIFEDAQKIGEDDWYEEPRAVDFDLIGIQSGQTSEQFDLVLRTQALFDAAKADEETYKGLLREVFRMDVEFVSSSKLKLDFMESAYDHVFKCLDASGIYCRAEGLCGSCNSIDWDFDETDGSDGTVITIQPVYTSNRLVKMIVDGGASSSKIIPGKEHIGHLEKTDEGYDIIIDDFFYFETEKFNDETKTCPTGYTPYTTSSGGKACYNLKSADVKFKMSAPRRLTNEEAKIAAKASGLDLSKVNIWGLSELGESEFKGTVSTDADVKGEDSPGDADGEPAVVDDDGEEVTDVVDGDDEREFKSTSGVSRLVDAFQNAGKGLFNFVLPGTPFELAGVGPTEVTGEGLVGEKLSEVLYEGPLSLNPPPNPTDLSKGGFAKSVVCGDGACGAEETVESCPDDCVATNEDCEEGFESVDIYLAQCIDPYINSDGLWTGENLPSTCGNGRCESFEKAACPGDCEKVEEEKCGNGNCDEGESTESCAVDCPVVATCGDETCSGTETSENCPDDCPVEDGDGDDLEITDDDKEVVVGLLDKIATGLDKIGTLLGGQGDADVIDDGDMPGFEEPARKPLSPVVPIAGAGLVGLAGILAYLIHALKAVDKRK